jgi:aminodeoxyfutalosine deaminase
MPTTLRARYVFPVTGDPAPDGFVCLEGERIVACGAGGTPAPRETRDLGNVAILPGLVNAHAHLDFSDLTEPLGHRGIHLVDWLRLVRESRRRPPSDCHPTTLGLDESLRNGVTAIADIVQPHQPPAASPVEVTALMELIAPTADRVAGTLELAKSYLQTAGRPGIRPGLSPHAPYSVHRDLLTAVVELSRRHEIPVAMHLAESPEELELLRHGRGPLRSLLEELGAWDATARPCPTRPLDYLRLLASAHRALIVHGSYLDDEEIGFLGANAERMSVVYCPRTCAWFAGPAGHTGAGFADALGQTSLSACGSAESKADKEKEADRNVCPIEARIEGYPLERMLAAGATVALGTDGRGSSPDLSLLNEMRFVARRHPSVPLARIVRMATLDGARALGRETEFGSLTPGKRADLAVVALPDRAAADPHELLFDPAATVVACYCHGRDARQISPLPMGEG